jgi:hypothetical protein
MPKLLAGVTQGDRFRMSSGIGSGYDKITPTRHHIVSVDQNRTHGDISFCCASLSFFQCDTHVLFVINHAIQTPLKFGLKQTMDDKNSFHWIVRMATPSGSL